jgi:hypothetical protein
MNDDQPLEPLEPLDLDDRSGGERMVAAGRAGADRFRELVADRRLDVVALIWMVSTATFVGVEIYSALRFFGGTFPGLGGWQKVAALAQTGGPSVAVSCLVGIALAAWFDTATARLAIFLATVTGAWVLAAGVLDIAASAHSTALTFSVTSGGNRAVGVIGGVGLAGLGLVVVTIALPLLSRPSERGFVSPPPSTPR